MLVLLMCCVKGKGKGFRCPVVDLPLTGFIPVLSLCHIPGKSHVGVEQRSLGRAHVSAEAERVEEEETPEGKNCAIRFV